MRTFGAALAAAVFFGNVALAAVDPIVIKVSRTVEAEEIVLTRFRDQNSSTRPMAPNSL